MTKVTVEQIKEVEKKSNQASDGSFSLGSTEHQDAAKFVEEFLTNYDTLAKGINDELNNVLATAAINALRDIQVRDYALGIINADNIKTINSALAHLVMVAPEGYDSPALTLLSVTYYEMGEEEKAKAILEKAEAEYSLAKLLSRVFEAGWPKESFQEMRNQLHPKVTAGIFGEDN
jgi:hypothetical protein